MDTIIERETDNSVVSLVLGIVAIAIIGAAALYFFRLFPFNAQENAGTQIEITVPTGSTKSSSIVR